MGLFLKIPKKIWHKTTMLVHNFNIITLIHASNYWQNTIFQPFARQNLRKPVASIEKNKEIMPFFLSFFFAIKAEYYAKRIYCARWLKNLV